MKRAATILFVVSLTVIACGDDGSITGPSRSSPTATFLSLRSDPGDYIGAGESHRYTLNDTVWQARATVGVMEPNHVTVSLRPVDRNASWWWTLDLAAPRGQPLRTGTYANARRYPFQDSQPGLSFSGTGRGCNTLTGTFTIREIQLGPDNTLDRLRATFEQHCEGSSAGLHGEISVAANPWR